MKFITEGELRDIYKKDPFTAYELMPETKLTPGARQFLTDLRIDLSGASALLRGSSAAVKAEAAANKPEGPMTKPAGNYGRQTKKLIARLRSVESLFLLTCKELLDKDVILAQEAAALERQLSGIRAAAQGNGQLEEICCKACTGISSEDFDKDVGDCFEISEFHMRLENGTEILNLHRLRCALREVEAFVPEAYEEGSNEENGLYSEIIASMNSIINSLSRMICTAIGGKKCQRIR